MMGEESSTQEKGRISSQNIAAGTKVEQYTTLKYYISKGQQAVTMPDLSGETGVDAAADTGRSWTYSECSESIQ